MRFHPTFGEFTPVSRVARLSDDERYSYKAASSFRFPIQKENSPCCLGTDMCPLPPEWPVGPYWQDPSSAFIFPHPQVCSLASSVKIKVTRDVSTEVLAKTHVAFASAEGTCVYKARIQKQTGSL